MTNTRQQLPRDGWFILVVDDDPTSLRIIEQVLLKNYTVCKAANAEEALAVLRERIPALVILDVMLPDVSGIDLCMIIKTSERLMHVPVIFISASDRPQDFKTGYDAGGVMYMGKPIRAEQLLLMVRLYASQIASKGIA